MTRTIRGRAPFISWARSPCSQFAGQRLARRCFERASASTVQPTQQLEHTRRQYRVGGTKYITVVQATNIIEAVTFARSLGLPLVAHLTIHWAFTDAGDDPDGKLFAKFRNGLNK